MSATQILHSIFNRHPSYVSSPSTFLSLNHTNNDTRHSYKECPKCGGIMRLDGVTDGKSSWNEFYCKKCGLSERA
jgi:predicted RNA-binding Zn-ribbon protein involved in translation (DUF1610 family)